MDIAFSTVACPEWPIDRAVALADELGYDGIELRTFGQASTRFACDPALTDSAKLREMFAGASVDPSCVATGITFDEPVWPPIIGRLRDYEGPVRDARWIVRRAAEFGGNQVRVFGFSLNGNEKRANCIRRIQDRLRLVVAAARNTSARIVVENGGSFSTAEQLAELIDGLDTRYIGAAYNAAAAQSAGEDPLEGLRSLGSLVANVKIKDYDEDGRPVALGDGAIDCETVVRYLESSGFGGWLTVEWDRAWFDGLRAPESALADSIKRIYSWREGLAAKKAFVDLSELEEDAAEDEHAEAAAG